MIWFQKTSTGIKMTTDINEAEKWLHENVTQTIWAEYKKGEV